MLKNVNLTNHFLIAMPAMVDPNFSKTITYICEHNDKGALGVVLNRPTDMTVQSLFDQINIATERRDLSDMSVHYGGPVQLDRGFVLHFPVGEWQSTLTVNKEVGLTTSKDVLEAVAQGAGPSKIHVTLGYAGWSAGQLEDELSQNAWLTVPASMPIIFDLPAEQRLTAAMDVLGVNYTSLVDNAGHA